MLKIEKELWSEGYKYIACIDEVGRGCLAGDVTACAIIMPKDCLIEGVNDSKKLSAKKREKLYDIIIEKSIAVGIGNVSCDIIDEINIKNATHLAMKFAISNIKDKLGEKIIPDILLIDAEKIDINIPQKNIIKGDSLCHGIAAASIIAKVTRDKYIEAYQNVYPEYGFIRNKGYGTKEHREALKRYGPIPIHRTSFLKKILSDSVQLSLIEETNE